MINRHTPAAIVAAAGLGVALLGGSIPAAHAAPAVQGSASAAAVHLSGSFLSYIPNGQINGLDNAVRITGPESSASRSLVNSEPVSTKDEVVAVLPDDVSVPLSLTEANVPATFVKAESSPFSQARSGNVDNAGNVHEVEENEPGAISLKLDELLGGDYVDYAPGLTVAVDNATATAELGLKISTLKRDYSIDDVTVFLDTNLLQTYFGSESSTLDGYDRRSSRNAEMQSIGEDLAEELALQNPAWEGYDIGVFINGETSVDEVEALLAANEVLGSSDFVELDRVSGLLTISAQGVLEAQGKDLNELDPGTELFDSAFVDTVNTEVERLLSEVSSAVTEIYAADHVAAGNQFLIQAYDPDYTETQFSIEGAGSLADIAEGNYESLQITQSENRSSPLYLKPGILESALMNTAAKHSDYMFNPEYTDSARRALAYFIDSSLTEVITESTVNHQSETANTYTQDAFKLSLTTLPVVGESGYMEPPVDEDLEISSLPLQEEPEVEFSLFSTFAAAATPSATLNFASATVGPNTLQAVESEIITTPTPPTAENLPTDNTIPPTEGNGSDTGEDVEITPAPAPERATPPFSNNGNVLPDNKNVSPEAPVSPQPVNESDTPLPAPAVTEVMYATCEDAQDAGRGPLVSGEPGYSTDLDTDGDGIACEDNVEGGIEEIPEAEIIEDTPVLGDQDVVDGGDVVEDISYTNCDEAQNAGRGPIYEGEPGYELRHDRDANGIACEDNIGSGTEDDRLADTGETPNGLLGITGGGLLLAGALILLLAQRRRVT